MTREEFVQRIVIAGYNGWMANIVLEGTFDWEHQVKQAHMAADALYGPAKQVESDEVLALREAFVDACNWIAEITDDPTCPLSIDTLRCAQAALHGYRDLYDKCRKALSGEGDNA